MLYNWNQKFTGLVSVDTIKCRRIVGAGEDFFREFAKEVNRLVQIEKDTKKKDDRRSKSEIRKEVLDKEIAELEAIGGDKRWPKLALALRAFKANGLGCIEQLPMNKAAKLTRLVSPMSGALSKKTTAEKIKDLIGRAKGMSAEKIKAEVDKLLSAKKAKPFWGQAAAKLSIENENSFMNEIAFFNALGRDDAWRLAEVLIAKCESADRAAALAAEEAAEEAAAQVETENAPASQSAEVAV